VETEAALQYGKPSGVVNAGRDQTGIPWTEMLGKNRADRPDIKELCVTRHIDRLMDTRLLWDGEAFLDKPFSMNGLVEAVTLLLYGKLSAKPQ